MAIMEWLSWVALAPTHKQKCILSRFGVLGWGTCVFCRVRPLIGEEIKINKKSEIIHHMDFRNGRTLQICKNANLSLSGWK
nr:uncharacterized protein LOC128702599 isoform X2 [Cherax quadricarinatus]